MAIFVPFLTTSLIKLAIRDQVLSQEFCAKNPSICFNFSVRFSFNAFSQAATNSTAVEAI